MKRWQMSLVVVVVRICKKEKRVGKAECLKVKTATTMTKKKKTKGTKK